MNVSWQNTLRIAEADGDIVEIAGPGDGASSTQLHRVGRTYGVLKLVSDPPHWSEGRALGRARLRKPVPASHTKKSYPRSLARPYLRGTPRRPRAGAVK